MKQATFLPMADLAKFIAGLDPMACTDPTKRDALVRFQRDVAVLGPGAAHRRAVALLEELGADLSDAFRRPLIHAVKGTK